MVNKTIAKTVDKSNSKIQLLRLIPFHLNHACKGTAVRT